MYRFRHALLREVVHDDLLPGEHAELHLALARALEQRAAAGAEDVWITAGMAHHFRSAGDQPAALKASVQAAAASARVHAHGEAAGLLERALEIWDRVPDAEALAGASHADVLVRAAAAHRSNVDDHRAPSCCGSRSPSSSADGDPTGSPRCSASSRAPVVARPRRGEPRRRCAARSRCCPRATAAPSAPSCSAAASRS